MLSQNILMKELKGNLVNGDKDYAQGLEGSTE